MIGYWRVSYGRENMISPEIQQAAITRWAQSNGRRIVRWIGDPDDTGRNFKRRVREAIAAIEAGEAAEIGVYRYSRWGRNALQSLANVKRVEDAGGGVVSATEPVDVETTFGQFTRAQAFLLAELESNMIADGWKSAHASRVNRGLPADGSPRFGYQRLGKIRDENRRQAWCRDPDDSEGERYAVDPETGPVLAALYERYSAGESVRSLVHWLNLSGVLTASGARWTRDSLRLVLASGFGAGLLKIHDPACRCKGTSRDVRDCPRFAYVPGAHEAVIIPETWQAFLERTQARKDIPARLRDPVHPLSGLLYCGTSGHRLTVTTDAGGVAYRCPRRAEGRDCPGAFVRATTAEREVLDWLSQWAADIEAAAAAETARRRTVTRAQAKGDQLAKREAVLQRKLARLMTRWANDESMEPEAYEMARKPLTDDLEAVRAAMRDAEGARKANVGEFVPIAAGLLETWPRLPPSRKRELLASMIARVEVHRTGARKPARLVIVPVWEAGE